jgi:hypothetical protein
LADAFTALRAGGPGRRFRGRLTAIAVASCLAAVGTVAGPAFARQDPPPNPSLPSVTSGPRPGPDILYAPPAAAPQLENTGIWRAPPILVSGASAYRDGEFLYQDFLYDDHGARGGGRDPVDPRAANDLASAPSGTYTYPTAAAYASNAADLVELRVKPLESSTAFRITLNTLLDPSLVATTIAIGDSPTPRQFPHGAGVSAPAQLFLTLHGNSAELTDAATGTVVATGIPVSIDLRRRQLEVRIPHSAWDPGSSTVRLAAGVGLWNTQAGGYLIPQVSADAANAGGGTLASPPAFFNVAFRYQESLPKPDFSILFDPAFWRDRDQGRSLAAATLAPFHAEVDFSKLAAGTDDDMPDQLGGVPQTGPINRILASHFETAQGADFANFCTTAERLESCEGELQGQLQPYAIYVPKKPAPERGFSLTLLLHSFGANYNQYLASRHQAQFGERGLGSIVITPEGRGPGGWYFAYAGADTFEVWADVARHYRLDGRRASIAGYSMGGYGTWKLAGQYPDLFSRAQPTVGPTVLGSFARTDTVHLVPSLRHIPVLSWLGAGDGSVPLNATLPNTQELDRLGYRYELDVFRPFNILFVPDHYVLAFNDGYQAAADFLGDPLVRRNPARVTYAYNPDWDFAQTGTVAGHAYWLSGLRLRSTAGDAPIGRIDVRSHGFGTGDPPAGPTEHGPGALTGGALGPLAYDFERKAWGETPTAAVADRLDIEAVNVAAVTIDPRRAQVSCRTELNVNSDGPIHVTLAGCRGNGWHRGQFKDKKK